jgi:hypothetical protein
MIKPIGNGNEPSAVDSATSPLASPAHSLNQAKVIAAKKTRSVDAPDADERARFNSSPLAGASVILPQ